jgi:hypothetical protein
MFSLSQEASALSQIQRERIAAGLDAAGDRAEARGHTELAARFHAVADSLLSGDGGGPPRPTCS